MGLNSGGGWGRWQPLPQASHAHSLRPCHVRKALASELGLGTSGGKGCFPLSRERPRVSVGAAGSGVCGSLSRGGRPADWKPPAQGRTGNDRNEPPKGRGSRRSWRKVPQGPDRNHCPLKFCLEAVVPPTSWPRFPPPPGGQGLGWWLRPRWSRPWVSGSLQPPPTLACGAHCEVPRGLILDRRALWGAPPGRGQLGGTEEPKLPAR